MNQILIIGGAFTALVIAYNVWGTAKVEEGRQQERASVEKQATKKDDKAQAARRAAAASDAARLLESRGELRPEPKP